MSYKLLKILLTVTILALLPMTSFAASKGNPPIAYWRFDEGGGGTAYDSSGSNNGTLNAGAGGTNTAVGQMWTKQGKIGGALECDGTDDQISTGTFSAAIGPNYTLALWIYPRGYTDLVSSNASQWIEQSGGVLQDAGFYSTNKFYVGMYINSTYYSYNSGTLTIPLNQWSFIAYTLSGQTLTFYLNGASYSQTIAAGTVSATTNAVRIGNYSTATYHFNGFIDDVRIYNYARTADQIMIDYNAGVVAYSGAGTDPNEGNAPVGYWPLDENTSTTAYDRSGNSNNGSISGASWTQGKYGSALSFNGVDNYVTIPNSSTLSFGTGNFTISLWAYLDSTGALQRLAGKKGVAASDAGYAIYYNPATQKLLYSVANGSTNGEVWTANTIPMNCWHHIVMVADSSDANKGYFYVDGVKYLISSASQNLNVDSSYSFDIGRIVSSSALPLKGKIDEVKVYNYARTPAQVAYDYSKGKPVAQYRFDEGSGTIAHNDYSSADSGIAPVGLWRMDNNWSDSSGNNNNGTTNGGMAFSSSAKIGPYCGSFNGTDSYIETPFPSQLAGNTNFTIEMWINPTSFASSWRWPIAFGTANTNQAYHIGINSTMTLELGWWNLHGPTTYALTAGQWTHIAVVYNGTNQLVYVNGVFKESLGMFGAAPNITAGVLRMGRQLTTIGEYFPGYLDDVRIYSYVRTPEQIYNDYKTTHGTLVGSGIKFVDGKIGKALQFNGSSDYVSGIHNISGDSQLTVGAWIKTSYSAARQEIVSGGSSSNGDGFLVYLDTNGKLNFDYPTQKGPTGSITISDGNWHYIVAVKDGSNRLLYVDGKSDGSGSLGAMNSSTNTLYIGRATYNNSNYTNGLIDDVRIYNYACTQAQVLQDYNANVSARLGAQSAGTADPWGGAMPVGWWMMDENTGVLANDASGNGNNGTLTNGPTWAQGKNGPCLSFDGNNDYVSIADNAALDGTTFTFSAWIYSNNIANEQMVYSNTNTTIGWHIEVYQSKTMIQVYPGGGYTFSTTPMSSNTWYHIAVTYNNGSIAYYLNGIPNGTATQTFSVPTGLAKRIGFFYNNSLPWNGKIDDVRIYNYVRTPAQIAWDYNGGKPVGYWRFDEGSGTTAYDDSDNNNDGTITIGSGGTQTTIASAWTNGATGKFGRCMSFDGTDDYVNVAYNSSLKSTEVTVEAWIKTTNPNKVWARVVNRDKSGYDEDPYSMDFSNTTGKIRFRVECAGGGFDAVSPSALDANRWYHVAGTYKPGEHDLYLDGKLVTTLSTNSPLNQTDTNLGIGRGTNDGYAFPGLIDDVRIYNYARTADQVAQDYNQGMAARLGD